MINRALYVPTLFYMLRHVYHCLVPWYRNKGLAGMRNLYSELSVAWELKLD